MTEIRLEYKALLLMRMGADRKTHVRPELFEALGLRRLAGVASLQDRHDALEASAPGARDDRVEIVREGLICQMAMTIDHGCPGAFEP